MKNTRKIFDGIEVIKPILVIKIGLVYDRYKHDQLDALWKECEEKMPERMPTFKADDFFFQEEIKDAGIRLSCRFYTPKSNIKVNSNND